MRAAAARPRTARRSCTLLPRNLASMSAFSKRTIAGAPCLSFSNLRQSTAGLFMVQKFAVSALQATELRCEGSLASLSPPLHS